MIITFNELRRIKDRLPSGSSQRIADELGLDVETVRNYFGGKHEAKDVYKRQLEKRVEDALSRMTLEEKVGLLHAQSKFSSAGVPRLGIPEVVQLYIGDKLSSQPRPVKELKGLKRYTSRPARAEPSRSKSTPGCSPVTTMRKGSGALNPVNSPLMSAPRRTTSAEPSISC